MPHPILRLIDKPSRVVMGFMSGTSADGVDAALVRISGCGDATRVTQLGFCFVPFDAPVRDAILCMAGGGEVTARDVCLMNVLLGRLYCEAGERVCRENDFDIHDIDLIGSHGQTVWHIPRAEEYLGRDLRGTLQIGEAALLAERFSCPVVSDFRVRDMAAGGLGAPLVPYTEFLLYRSPSECIALQNIGGIGNITVMPAACALSDVVAFDTGPGNMVMDALARDITGGNLSYDEGGQIAARGRVSEELLAFMLDDPYLTRRPPKTTGREYYGEQYVSRLLSEAARLRVSKTDALTTATRFTAETVALALRLFVRQKPARLIVGGGGALNPTLMADLRALLPDCRVMTNEDMGLDGNAKEAVAFALLANEAIFARANNAPSATGALHPVVMGKINL